MNSWGVAALADEPAALIAAFAAHHLESGASRVHIMLDRPNDEARDLLSGVAEVELVDAGADGWGYFGPMGPPARHLGRQKYHASRVLHETKLDWLLHCDVDEYLVPMKVRGLVAPPVGLILSLLDHGADWGNVPVAERVWLEGGSTDVLGGPFRLPWTSFQDDGAEVYSEASMMQLRMGLSGHNLGKGIVRSGRGSYIGIHRPMRDYAGKDVTLTGTKVPHVRLLHFDGVTLLHYALKMMRRALADQTKNPPPHSPHRRLQFTALAGAEGDVALIREQWSAAKTITRDQAEQLRKRDKLWDFDPQIISRGTTIVPALSAFNAASFDKALIAREKELITRAHQAFGFDPEPLVSA